MLRGHGGSWPQPGDPLVGQSTAYLLRAAASAIAEAEALEHAMAGALRVDTDGLTVEETADLIAARGPVRTRLTGNLAKRYIT